MTVSPATSEDLVLLVSLKRDGVGGKADRVPESQTRGVGGEHLEGDALAREVSGEEQFDATSAKTLTAQMTLHEKLAQVDRVAVVTPQRVAYDVGIQFEDDGLILALEPSAHAFGELDLREARPRAFVDDQLRVERGEGSGVGHFS